MYLLLKADYESVKLEGTVTPMAGSSVTCPQCPNGSWSLELGQQVTKGDDTNHR